MSEQNTAQPAANPAPAQQTAAPQPKPPVKAWETFSWIAVATLLGLIVYSIKQTLGWALTHDAPIMHYIAQQILDGAVPYKDIFDMNMPMTYFIHMGVISFIGNDAANWRLFDLAWLVFTCITIIIFCKRQGILSGLIASAIFASLHVSSGEIMAGQRDFLMAPFLVLGGHWFANITEDKHKIISSLLAGIAFSIAFWIKPYCVILFIAVFLYAKIYSRSIIVSLFSIIGFLIPCVLVLGYLSMNGALGSWWEIMSQYLIPIYSTIGGEPDYNNMIFLMLASLGILLPFLMLSTPLTGRFFITSLGMIYGVLHFLLQKKGFSYHLSPLFVWAALFAAYRFGSNIKAARNAPRFSSFVCIVLVCILASPLYLLSEEKLKSNHDDITEYLVKDLRPQLKAGDTIQVMDHTSGAIHALLQLNIKQPTRFLRDFHFFTATDHRYVQGLEDEFIAELNANPPRIIILTNNSWPDARSGFQRFTDSPGFLKFLSQYRIHNNNPRYRIMYRRDNPPVAIQ